MTTRSHPICAVAIALLSTIAQAQHAPTTPNEDIEQVLSEASQTPEKPFSIADRPIYGAIQQSKKELNEKFGVNFAIEDTAIYQVTSGGVEPNDAMVNTLGFFATWKLFRAENGKDFAGFGFQAEQRGDPMDDHFTDLSANLGTLWSPNDSTSNDYFKINQLWWGQQLADGRFGLLVGKIDPGSRINQNRFAGSGNTQFFGQPYATNPARSFPDNGLGFMLHAEPVDWLFLHFTMSDSDAVSTHSPFTTINGHWLYAGEIGLQPEIPNLGKGIYRLMVYQRDIEGADEFGWSISADQNLSSNYGVFLRYGGNDAGIDNIKQLISAGFSWLAPFGRPNDQAGIAFAYTHPSSSALRDEYSSEIYYRIQVTEGFELSASAQLIHDPSDSDLDTVAVFGLRARLLF